MGSVRIAFFWWEIVGKTFALGRGGIDEVG